MRNVTLAETGQGDREGTGGLAYGMYFYTEI